MWFYTVKLTVIVDTIDIHWMNDCDLYNNQCIVQQQTVNGILIGACTLLQM